MPHLHGTDLTRKFSAFGVKEVTSSIASTRIIPSTCLTLLPFEDGVRGVRVRSIALHFEEGGRRIEVERCNRRIGKGEDRTLPEEGAILWAEYLLLRDRDDTPGSYNHA